MTPWTPIYEDQTMRCMGGYNVTNARTSDGCPNVGRAPSGKWVVVDATGKVWQNVEFSSRGDAARAAYMLSSVPRHPVVVFEYSPKTYTPNHGRDDDGNLLQWGWYYEDADAYRYGPFETQAEALKSAKSGSTRHQIA